MEWEKFAPIFIHLANFCQTEKRKSYSMEKHRFIFMFTNCHASAFYSQHRVKKYMQPWINGLLSASHRNIEVAVRAKSLAPAIGYGTRTRSPPSLRNMFSLDPKTLGSRDTRDSSCCRKNCPFQQRESDNLTADVSNYGHSVQSAQS